MKNTFGQNVTLTLFGESHGEAIGATIDGLSPGIRVDEEKISKALALRRPAFSTDTARRETDEFSILSGVFHGVTTGSPVTITIKNQDVSSASYEETRGLARPSHADYAAFCKYGGYEDYRGGGHFSGRITAAIVAAGAIFSSALSAIGIRLGSHILRCGGVCDGRFSIFPEEEIAKIENDPFPVLNENVREKMKACIVNAASAGDSVGGEIETAICGVPAGLGEPWFDGADSLLAHALFSLGGVKGVSFGDGFSLSNMRGSEANDAFYVAENGKIFTTTNRSGGINGGVTNGMPVVFTCAIKPTPSIALPQKTVNFLTHENTTLAVKGKHDPAIVRRVVPVINAISALVVCDLLTTRYGANAFTKNKGEV